jgi:hypothetical protein
MLDGIEYSIRVTQLGRNFNYVLVLRLAAVFGFCTCEGSRNMESHKAKVRTLLESDCCGIYNWFPAHKWMPVTDTGFFVACSTQH